MVKNLPANAGDAGDMDSVPGLRRSQELNWRRKWQPTLVFLLGKFHRQKSLAGSWDQKESDMTARLNTHAGRQALYRTLLQREKKKTVQRLMERRNLWRWLPSLFSLCSSLAFAFSVNLTLKVNSRQFSLFKLALHSHLRKHTQLLPKCSIGNNLI